MSGEAARNTIATLEATGAGEVYGISNNVVNDQAVIRDNTIVTGTWDNLTGIGLSCSGAIVRDNVVSGFTTALSGCADAGGNFSN